MPLCSSGVHPRRLGQDWRVPRLTEPALPERLLRIARAFGMNTTQVGILYVLAQTGGANMPELMKHLGLRRETIRAQLKAMEKDGLVTADLPAGAERRGRAVLYRPVKERIRADLAYLVERLTPRE